MTKQRDPTEELFSIGDVAEATGISVETLRIWERRYGRPEPVRLPSGHRRFTSGQVRWLRRIAEALALRHRPGHILKLADAALDELLGPAVEPEVDEEIRELIDLARAYDAKGLTSRLKRHWRRDRCLAFLTRHLAPFITAVGRAWADGDLDVRHEHFVSEVIQDLLRAFRLGYSPAAGSLRVLLTTLPGEKHGLGLQMAALVCASRRVPIRNLGTETPPDEILEAVKNLRPRAVGISVSLATGGVDTDREIGALRKQLPIDVKLFVGGGGARGIRRGPRNIAYVESLEGWDGVVEDLAR